MADFETKEHNQIHARPEGSMGYVALVAAVAALGGLLFGYDTAVISGAIGFLRARFELSPMMTGWAASSALVGCILGALCAGTLSDRFGRKRIMMLAGAMFLISALWSAIAYQLFDFIIARIIGGVGVGAASMLSPLYIAEISPAKIRGRLVSVNQFAIISGMLVVYFVNAIIAQQGSEAWNVQYGWRWMFGSEALPAGLFFGLLFLVPESPRWLTEMGKEDPAKNILSRIGGDEHAKSELLEIKATIAMEGGSIWEVLKPGIRTALFIGVGLAIFQQITGINTVLYYAPEIFRSAGLTADAALSDTVIVGIVNLAFTVVAIAVVDKLGRKPLLLIASAGMSLSLFFLGRAIRLEQFDEGRWVLFFVLTYVASFAVAMGPVVWVVMSEIFPTKIRGRAMSVATVCLWVACFFVSLFFPYMLETLQGLAFWVYAVISALAFVFVLLILPETKGKTLEEIAKSWL